MRRVGILDQHIRAPAQGIFSYGKSKWSPGVLNQQDFVCVFLTLKRINAAFCSMGAPHTSPPPDKIHTIPGILWRRLQDLNKPVVLIQVYILTWYNFEETGIKSPPRKKAARGGGGFRTLRHPIRVTPWCLSEKSLFFSPRSTCIGPLKRLACHFQELTCCLSFLRR